MTEILLIRHAINDWVSTGKLAGWTPGVHLNPDGRKQAAALGERLASTKLAAIYASPLERTMETAEAIASHHTELSVQPTEGIGEVRYGTWQGEKLARLRREAMWSVVQHYPSRVQFPAGETIRQAQARAVDTVEALARTHAKQRIVLVSHSDVIKLIVAHYLGAHIDMFQRIEISPASLTILHLGSSRPTIACMNDTGFLPHIPQPEPRPSMWANLQNLFKRI